MKKTISILVICLVTINLFASIKKEYSKKIRKLNKKRNLVSTYKDLKAFNKEEKKEILSFLKKVNQKDDEEKIIAARLLNMINMPEKAIKYLQKVKDTEKYKNFYHSTLGETYFLLGKYKKSIQEFKKANIEQPRVALDCLYIGFGLIKEKKYKMAENIFKKFLENPKSFPRIKYLSAIGLFECSELSGKIKEGETYLNKIAKTTSKKELRKPIEKVALQYKLLGKRAPEIKNIELQFNGKHITINKKNGKYTLLFFFSGRSIQSIKAMAYIDSYKNHMNIIGINLFPQKTDKKRQEKFFKWYVLQNKKITYPVVFLSNDRTYRDYGVQELPHFVLINPDGYIEKVFIEFQEKNLNPMLGYLNSILKHTK